MLADWTQFSIEILRGRKSSIFDKVILRGIVKECATPLDYFLLWHPCEGKLGYFFLWRLSTWFGSSLARLQNLNCFVSSSLVAFFSETRAWPRWLSCIAAVVKSSINWICETKSVIPDFMTANAKMKVIYSASRQAWRAGGLTLFLALYASIDWEMRVFASYTILIFLIGCLWSRIYFNFS